MEGMVGYRFYPTDREIVLYYLQNMICGNQSLVSDLLNAVNIYAFDPWDLPSQSKVQGDHRAYFFLHPIERKHSKNKKLIRRTKRGFWKVTEHRTVKAAVGSREIVGRKTYMVFYKGQFPKGKKTSWVMREYCTFQVPPNKRTYVLCKLKNTSTEQTFESSCDGVQSSRPPCDSERGDFLLEELNAPSSQPAVNKQKEDPCSVKDTTESPGKSVRFNSICKCAF